jgi:hypothetical protein
MVHFMKKKHSWGSSIHFVTMGFLIFLMAACIEQKDTEVEKPEIHWVSPLPCDTLYFGESTDFKLELEDNTGLGNLSMDIHHNFGHHDHGAHESCDMDAVKDAVNPFSKSWIFPLPDDQLIHVLEESILFPGQDDLGNPYDEGDYHFHIYVTDNEGYQAFTTMDVKVLNR